jgi:hypothetical protein
MEMTVANRYSNAAKAAADLTNKQLAEELAKLGPANAARLNELLPEKKDKEAFAKLMAIVENETRLDNQLAFLAANLQTAGKAALRVLKFFA